MPGVGVHSGAPDLDREREVRMEVQELIGALFNIALVVMIVATMVSAGFTTTMANLGKVLSRVGLVLLVLATGLVIRPLVGVLAWIGALLACFAPTRSQP